MGRGGDWPRPQRAENPGRRSLGPDPGCSRAATAGWGPSWASKATLPTPPRGTVSSYKPGGPWWFGETVAITAGSGTGPASNTVLRPRPQSAAAIGTPQPRRCQAFPRPRNPCGRPAPLSQALEPRAWPPLALGHRPPPQPEPCSPADQRSGRRARPARASSQARCQAWQDQAQPLCSGLAPHR